MKKTYLILLLGFLLVACSTSNKGRAQESTSYTERIIPELKFVVDSSTISNFHAGMDSLLRNYSKAYSHSANPDKSFIMFRIGDFPDNMYSPNLTKEDRMNKKLLSISMIPDLVFLKQNDIIGYMHHGDYLVIIAGDCTRQFVEKQTKESNVSIKIKETNEIARIDCWDYHLNYYAKITWK